MIDEDIALLDIETSFASPLDRPEEELPRPDPDEMLALLDSESVLERMQAARAFCELEDRRAIPHLIDLLQDDCTLVRVSAAYALGRNPSTTAVLPLIAKLDQEWNGYVRKGIVWALGTCKDRRALAPLISALKYDIAAVRLWAASALGQLGDLSAIESLTETLQSDRIAAVRSNCAWSLGKLLRLRVADAPHRRDDIYHDALDALIGALEDDDLSVQDDAKITIRKLGDPRGLRVLEQIEIEQGYCDLF
ncbi:HEAT repeat domain-containing protein [Pseudanabaena sp. PCC 6802]|uniref:HEAT repeat domain-containing protein n=1 Tax=Pseudanabaena sp. PCC 6802 TaxID=118173 RepID=UPI0003451081|nr:HEAT repeat domain-containing protein [Pseudanabaena sp. PCC 6802]